MIAVSNHEQWEPSATEITTIALDLAKNFFQAHGVDEAGAAMLRKTLRRSQRHCTSAAQPRPQPAPEELSGKCPLQGSFDGMWED